MSCVIITQLILFERAIWHNKHMSLSVEETKPSPNPEQTEARQALTSELKEIAEQQGQELVDKFVDSRGIERKPTAELVRLNPEACEAIDSFFKEHDELADSIETLLVFTEDLAPHAQKIEAMYESRQRPKPLSELTDPQSINEAIQTAINGPSPSPEALPQEVSSKIQAQLEKIQAQQAILSIPAPGQDAGSILIFIESLPDNLRQGWQFPGSMKLRMSGSARSEALGKISMLIDSAREDERTAKIILTSIISDYIPTAIKPALEQVRPLQTGIDTENHGHNTWDKRLNAQGNISTQNAPTQNEVVVAELTPEIQELTQQFEYMQSCEQALKGALSTPQIAEALKLLEKSDIESLSQRIAKGNQELLSTADFATIMKGFEQTFQMAPILYNESLYRATKAIRTLYNEPALPKLYISPQEEARLQALIAMHNQLAPGTQLDPQAQLEEIKSPNFETRSPLEMYTHASPYISAILQDGSLRTKQQQVDVLGTLHEQTKSGVSEGDVITTHSSVIHFSNDISHGYVGYPPEGYQAGVLFIPLGKIIQTAPIDYLGRQLITLPVSGSQVAPPQARTASYGTQSYGDDFVFYSSPKASERDNYSIELDEDCGVVLIGDEASAAQYSKPGGPIVEAAPSNDQAPVSQASGQVQRELLEHSEYSGSIVVPLRIAPMEFVAEVPNARIPNRFHYSTQKEIRGTGGVRRIMNPNSG